MKKAGFTLIELIVVITILAILGTIAFIGLKGYKGDARDSKITTDIANLHNSLAILKATKGVVPIPENYKTVTNGTTPITYEGEIGDNVRSAIKASKDMKTPTGENYKYAIKINQKEFTLVGIMENEVASLTTTAFANSNNNKFFKGGTVTTLFDTNDNFKDGDILALSTGDEIFIGELKAPVENNKMALKTCQDILDYSIGKEDGIYSLYEGEKYCDMKNGAIEYDFTKVKTLSFWGNGKARQVFPKGTSGKIYYMSTWWGNHSVKMDLNSDGVFEYDMDEDYSANPVIQTRLDGWYGTNIASMLPYYYGGKTKVLEFTDGLVIQDYELWYPHWSDPTHGNNRGDQYHSYGVRIRYTIDGVDDFICKSDNTWSHPGDDTDFYCKDQKDIIIVKK